MGQQMNTILLLLIFTGLVGLLLVVFFMLDRLNELHKHADLQKTPHVPDDTFGGLTGKTLWDAMIGIPLSGWDAKKLEPLKPRYEAVLQKHLELLFEDGKLDAREGFAMPVRCDRVVPTLRGEIEFQNVRLAYGDGTDVLHDITLTAKPGETVALVGPTGAGKSSLVGLLMRFYESTGGTITLDGQDIRNFAKKDLRRVVGLVSQESFLFNGTVADNLRFGKPGATDEELWAALRAANAAAFVEKLPKKLDTEVGERGVRLSVGEKQRISIARALLKDPPVLLLDEATASVDNATEKLIQQALDRLLQKRTSFVIAHRLSTVRHADQILVLDHGKIVERGKHDELLARGGLYAKLCAGTGLLNES